VAVDYEVVRKAAREYADDVRAALPVDRAVLFGSYAKGCADEQSDVDICFFLRDFGGRTRFNIIGRLLELCGHFKGFYFEPIAFETSEIARGNPFVVEVLRTGVEI
jgi:predicted nucleotidyltransferase